MRRAKCFLFLAALALAFAVSGGASLYSCAAARSLSAETVYGRREAAEGFGLELTSVVNAHLVLDTAYDPASGISGTGVSWPAERTGASRTARGPSLHATAYYSAYSSGGAPPADPVFAEIFSDLLPQGPGDDAVSGKAALNDYTSCVPLLLTGSRLNGEDSTEVYGALCVPLPGEIELNVQYMPRGQYNPREFSAEYLSGEYNLNVDSSSVFAPDGWLYFVLDLRLESSGERLDGSLLPGGDWGVFRVRCTPDADTSAERWWAQEDFTGECSFENIENVFIPGADWYEAKLDLSHDGERLLLCTREDGGLFLTVLDAATGAFVQRLRLFTPEETAGRYLGMAASLSGFHSGAGSVFVLRPAAQRDGIAAACAYSDGEYRQLFTADTRLEAVPDWFPDSADAWADANAVDFITDGERMAVLYSVTCSLPELSAGDLYRTHALAVFGSGGAEYAEWLAPVRPETYIFLPPQPDGCRTVWLDEAYRLTLTGRRP